MTGKAARGRTPFRIPVRIAIWDAARQRLSRTLRASGIGTARNPGETKGILAVRMLMGVSREIEKKDPHSQQGASRLQSSPGGATGAQPSLAPAGCLMAAEKWYMLLLLRRSGALGKRHH